MTIEAEPTPVADTQLQRAGMVMAGSMAFVALRCTIQYIVLPFLLPLLGIGDFFSAALHFGIGLVALSAIAYNNYRLWNTSWRWRYLSFSSFIAFIILVFLYEDISHLLALT